MRVAGVHSDSRPTVCTVANTISLTPPDTTARIAARAVARTTARIAASTGWELETDEAEEEVDRRASEVEEEEV